ncbi:hypothetical protein AB0T37_22460, partial [Escherichia coli]
MQDNWGQTVHIINKLRIFSQAATLDVRGGYRSGSHAYETRLKVSE